MGRWTGRQWAVVGAAAIVVVGLNGVSFAGGMITGADIQNNSVTTADIENGSLRTKDLSGGAVDDLAQAATPLSYSASSGGPVELGPTNADFQVVVDLSLPPGSYNGSLTGTATNAGATTTDAVCSLGLSNGVVWGTPISVPPGQSVSIAQQQVFTVRSQGVSAQLQCYGANITITSATITATSMFPGD